MCEYIYEILGLNINNDNDIDIIKTLNKLNNPNKNKKKNKTTQNKKLTEQEQKLITHENIKNKKHTYLIPEEIAENIDLKNIFLNCTKMVYDENLLIEDINNKLLLHEPSVAVMEELKNFINHLIYSNKSILHIPDDIIMSARKNYDSINKLYDGNTRNFMPVITIINRKHFFNFLTLYEYAGYLNSLRHIEYNGKYNLLIEYWDMILKKVMLKKINI